MAVLLALSPLLACGDPGPARASLTVAEAMAGDTAGYARATVPREFAFPEDHGPHPAYRTEWWYFTGNLVSEGRDFGFQLTFFRNALRPDPPAVDSDWATRQAFMGHFAVTDIAGERFHAFERFDRGAVGLAGAVGEPLRVWVGDWEATVAAAPEARVAPSTARAAPPTARAALSTVRAASSPPRAAPSNPRAAPSTARGAQASPGDPSSPRPSPSREGVASGVAPEAEAASEPPSSDSLPTFHVRAAQDGVGVALTLRAVKPVVLQGDRGLSQKGPEPGNASYYYSFTRLQASGTVTVDGREHPVSGLAWLDREWSTSALSPGLVGWDWFALQLNDGTELMVYRLREDDGGTAPFSAGTFVRSDGSVVPLEADDFVLEATGRWTSPEGARYPSGWRVRVPRLDLELTVEPRLRNQELDLAFRYWEGAVAVEGSRDGGPLTGRGYAELTGYADEPRP